MSGGGRRRREAEQAAQQANQRASELEKQTAQLKKQKEDERLRAQRMLIRSVRAGASGMYEQDTLAGQQSSGTLG